MLLYLSLLAAEARPAVVILISEPIDEYIEPSESFQESFAGSTQVIHLHRDYDRALKIAADLKADPPPLIYAVGKEAAYIAAQEVTNTPVLYSMVHNPEKYGIYGSQITGIRIEPPADLVLSQFRLFAPKVKTIAIFASDSPPTEIFSSALQAASDLGYKITLKRVNSSVEVRKSLLTIDDSVDAIWLLPDPQIITPDNFYYITNLATRMRLPVLASSERLVQAGALLSVSPDRISVGQQAAQLATEMLNEDAKYGGQTFLPDLPRVTLNTTVQRKINWEIAPMAMSFVTQTVE